MSDKLTADVLARQKAKKNRQILHYVSMGLVATAREAAALTNRVTELQAKIDRLTPLAELGAALVATPEFTQLSVVHEAQQRDVQPHWIVTKGRCYEAGFRDEAAADLREAMAKAGLMEENNEE